MATDNKLSVLVESQLPSFLADDGPKLVAFIKAYYEFLEQTGQQSNVLQSFQSNQDIDTTDLAKFYEYFRREILVNFPEDVLVDKRLLVKKIKEVYERKGSLNAHKLLFRLIYNEDISFINPEENILKASDGRFVKTNSFRIGEPFTGDPDTLVGVDVVGVSSGATGTVTDIVTTFESGIEVKQLFLKDDVGVFEDGEIVSNQDNTISGKIVTEVGSLADVFFGDVAFLTGGSGHVLGDRVNFNSASGSGANGTVTATTDRATTFTLVSGGSGYTNNAVVTITGGVGSGGSVDVLSITNTEVLFTYDDIIDDLKDTPIGFGPTYSSNSGSISANLASSNASTSLVTALGTTAITVGTIDSISVTGIGNYTTLPTVSVLEETIADQLLPDGSGGFKGINAVISPLSIPGAITDVEVDNGGSRYNSIDSLTITNTTRTGTTPATGDPVVSGVFIDEGRYVDTKGFVSWDQRIQDSYYYQIFSYVIKSEQALKTYKKIVNDIIHPAGTKLFGQVDLEEKLDFRNLFQVSDFSQIEGITLQSIDSTVTFGDLTLNGSISIDLGIEATTTIPVNHSVSLVYDIQSIESTIAIPNHNVVYVVSPDSILSTAQVNVEVLDFEFDLPAIDSTLIFGDTVTGKTFTANSVLSTSIVSVPVMGRIFDPLTINSTESFEVNNTLNFIFDLESITSTEALSTNTRLFLDGVGTISIANNNTITTYLGQPIENFLDQPIVLQGSPLAITGNNTLFTVNLSPGVLIEIDDQVPGLTANTIAVVNTIFSNTSLTINEPYSGGNTEIAFYRYTT